MKRFWTRSAAVGIALAGLAAPASGFDLEAPEAVAGPYVPVSAWAIGPAIDSLPAHPMVPWYRPAPPDTRGWRSAIAAAHRVLTDWNARIDQAFTESVLAGEFWMAEEGPTWDWDPPRRRQMTIAPTVPAPVGLAIGVAVALQRLEIASFEPHADLAWAEVPAPLEEPYRLVTFMGEGEQPHGTLDFAGHSATTGTIPAE